MKDLKGLLGKSISEEAIAELMLARSALEQKNEIIDAKDAVIRELVQKNRSLERELDEVLRTAPAAENAGGRTGVESLVEDIVMLLLKCEKAPVAASLEREIPAVADLEREIVGLLRDRWGLEVIEGEPASVDPYIHRVIEVVKGSRGGEKAVPLSRGYRLGKKVLAPMKLRVIEGVESQDGGESRSERGA